MTEYRVAVDVGGTFTDVCVLDETTEELHVAKVPSTLDPIEGVLHGLTEARIDPSQISLLTHGTTVATNALLTRNLPRAAMVTTRGFRDVIEIGRGTKQDLWDTYKDTAPPYIRRRDRYVVTERTDYSGSVLEPLDEAEADEVAQALEARGIEAIAVCFINAHANPANEIAMKELLSARLPDASISTSSDVLPEIFEHERFSTTVVNAILGPVVGSYSKRLGNKLTAQGYEGDLLLLHSGGGVMTSRTAERYAGRLAGSGIAAGAIAAQRIALTAGFDNAIGFDMGGTSTDVSVMQDGELPVHTQWYIEYGYPIGFPSIEVLTIGAGGGSLAWVDEGGSLRSGPASAGASPGPACYGQGNDQPTTSDAHAVLGFLGKELIGGAMSLDHDAARRAVTDGVGDRLDMSAEDASTAILRVANANMANAVRLVSIKRGQDPRDFVLVSFGGAGPLHAVSLARELAIPVVLVPRHPGVTAAQGCLFVDLRHDLSTMLLARADDVDAGEIENAFRSLEQEAKERLESENVDINTARFDRAIDMRYLGQWRSITVPVNGELRSLTEAVDRFHDLHEAAHDYRRQETPVELYRLTLRAIGPTPQASLERGNPMNGDPKPFGARPVRFEGEDGPVKTPLYKRRDLGVDGRIAGPAIVEELDSTTVIPPGATATVDEWLNIRIAVDE